MIKIGLIGEDPYDTTSLKNLLERKYKGKISCEPILKNYRGYALECASFKRNLGTEARLSGCKYFIYIRDLDDFYSSKKKVSERKNWFEQLNKKVGNGLFLLNVWELEALILSDISTFNRLYRTNIFFKSDPMLVKEPKEYLQRKTKSNQRKYKEADCPNIFKELNLDTLVDKCRYFNEFINEFEQLCGLSK